MNKRNTLHPARFVHLSVCSHYSLHCGLARVSNLIIRCQCEDMPAMALSDFNNFSGVIGFYTEAKSAGIKPIIAMKVAIQAENHAPCLLTLIAENNQGYHNICRLISNAYQRPHTDSPLIMLAELAQFKEGIIVLAHWQNDIEPMLDFYQRHFNDRFYLAISRVGRENEERDIQQAVAMSQKFAIPLVAVNDVMFAYKVDFEAYEIRVAIADGYTLDDPARPKRYTPQQYFKSEEEMCALFADLPEALANTVRIAKRCNVFLERQPSVLPQFPTGELSAADYLVKKAREGLEERLVSLFPDTNERQSKRSVYYERLQRELDVINKRGVASYFLIVMEYVQWAKSQGIPVGPGRGSSAGSLVLYALNVTNVDPIAFNLLFEHFYDPYRRLIPYIDVDFCVEGRDRVIEHVIERYGACAVSPMLFGRMRVKKVVHSVGRAVGLSSHLYNRIAKLIPSQPGMTLSLAYQTVPKLWELYNDNDARRLIDNACALEELVYRFAKHPNGVLIAPTAISDFMPIYCDKNGQNPIAQLNYSAAEYMGVVKFDFLGLPALTIMKHALTMINARLQQENKAPVQIEQIPQDDKKVFELLCKAQTEDVFMLESQEMRELILQLQPDNFEDLIALIALFRPETIEAGIVELFVNRKHGRDEVAYPDSQYQHECLKPILESTYGVILYQEQAMQIIHALSEYPLSAAEDIRRTMARKKPEEMMKQGSWFEEMEMAERKGINGELAGHIFDFVEKFARYTFNKSHAAAYALVSYQMLWLKAHYPAEFMTAVNKFKAGNL